MAEGPGIRLGGAFYEVVLSDESVRAQFEALRTESERLAFAIQNALTIRTQGGGQISNLANAMNAAAQGVAQQRGSVQDVVAVLGQMGVREKEAIDGMRNLGVIAQVSSRQVVQALTEQGNVLQQLNRLRAQAAQQEELLSRVEAERVQRIGTGAARARFGSLTPEEQQARLRAGAELTLPQTQTQAQRLTADFQRALERQGATAPIPSDLISFDERAGRYRLTRPGAEQLGGRAGTFATRQTVEEQARLAQVQQPADIARIQGLTRGQEAQQNAILAQASAQADRDDAERQRQRDREQRTSNALNAQRNRALDAQRAASEREERQSQQVSQRRAETLAREAGAPFSVLGTGRLVAPRGFQVPEEFRGRFAGTGAQLVDEGAAGAPPVGGGIGGFFARAFPTTPSNILRGGLALAGIPAGISLIAGLLRDVHQAIVDIVDSQINWERSLRTVSALYGTTNQQIATIAATQARVPGTLGTQEEFLGAQLAATPLARRVGIPEEQITQLISASYARFTALNIPQPQRESEMRAILQAVRTGGELPPEYGIALDPTALARRIGLPGAQGIEALTAPEQARVRAATVSADLTQQAQAAESNRRAALEVARNAQALADSTRTSLQTAIERSGEQRTAIQRGEGVPGRRDVGMADFITAMRSGQLDVGRPDIATRGAGAEIAAERAGRGGVGMGDFIVAMRSGQLPTSVSQSAEAAAQARRELDALTEAERAAQQALDESNSALAEQTRAVIEAQRIQQDANNALQALMASAEGAAARLAAWAGDIEDSRSVLHLDQIVQATAQAAQRAAGGVPILGQTPEIIERTARQTAIQQAYERFFAGPQAARAVDENDPVFRALSEIAQGRPAPLGGGPEGPVSPEQQERAQRALTAVPRYQQAQQQLTVIGQANAFIDIAQQTASGQLTRIQNQEQQRLRDRVQETTAARRQELQAQAEMAPLTLRQLDLQRDITVASQENLQLRLRAVQAELSLLPARQEIARLELQIGQQVDHQAQVRLQEASFEAQQAARGPQRSLEDIDYRRRLLTQQYAASIVGEMQGAAPTADYQASIDELMDLAYRRIQEQPGATEAERGVVEAGRAQEDQAAQVQRAQFPAQERVAAIQDATKAQEASFLELQQQEEQERLQIQARVIPLQEAQRSLEAQVFSAQRALTVAQQHSAEIQRSVELQNLEDAAIIAYWQTQLSGAADLKTYATDAANAAVLFAQEIAEGANAAQVAAGYLHAIADLQAQPPAQIAPPPPGGQPQMFLNPSTGNYEPIRVAAAPINFNGDVNINSQEDIERIAADAASQAGQDAYNRVKTALLRGLNTAVPSLTPSLPGAQR